jgi:hypothetical protein
MARTHHSIGAPAASASLVNYCANLAVLAQANGPGQGISISVINRRAKLHKICAGFRFDSEE